MVCDCFISKEDRDMGYEVCGEDCFNRMFYIEWYGFGFILFLLYFVFFWGGGVGKRVIKLFKFFLLI